MPSAIQYDRLSDMQRRNLEDAFERERDARIASYNVARAYYDGNHRRHLKPDNTKTEDNVTVNLTRLIIDKSVATLLGITDANEVAGVMLDVADEPTERGSQSILARAVNRLQGQTGEDNPVQQYLDAVMKANMSLLLWSEVATLGALSGHNFVKIMPDGKLTELGQPVPRLVGLNPRNTFIFWAQEDRQHVLWYRVQYDNVREDIVRNEATEQGGDGWTIYRYTRPRDYGKFELQESEPWPYPWPPVVDWPQNPNPGGVYGRSDAEDLVQMNDQYNFVLSNTQRILKHHAHPKTVATGVGADEIKPSGINNLWSVVNDQARITNLEMQSDLASSMRMAETLRRAMFDQARELDPGTVQDQLGQLTNFGLRVLNNDRLTKAGVQRMLWTSGLQRIIRALLDVGGFDTFIPVNIEWPDILTHDPVQQTQALMVDAQHGMSQYTYLKERGYDPDLEEQRRAVDIREQLAQGVTLAQRAASARLRGET